MISKKENKLHFLEENYQNYTQKGTVLHVTIACFRKQGQTRTNSGPIILPLGPTSDCIVVPTPRPNLSAINPRVPTGLNPQTVCYIWLAHRLDPLPREKPQVVLITR